MWINLALWAYVGLWRYNFEVHVLVVWFSKRLYWPLYRSKYINWKLVSISNNFSLSSTSKGWQIIVAVIAAHFIKPNYTHTKMKNYILHSPKEFIFVKAPPNCSCLLTVYISEEIIYPNSLYVWRISWCSYKVVTSDREFTRRFF